MMVVLPKKSDLSFYIECNRCGKLLHIEYDDDMPLTAELQYFIDHLNGDPIKVNNSENAIEVIKILELATNSLMENN